jgi:hypothetical protein
MMEIWLRSMGVRLFSIVLESFGFASFFGVFLEDMLQSISRNFDHKCSEVRCEVRKFVAKFKRFIMRFTNQFVNDAFDWLLLLQGPIRALFTNWLVNSNMNFQTSQRTCELRNEVRNICGQRFNTINII